jgi:hypothetical protein
MTYPNAIGWTTEQFVEFCRKNNACVGGLAKVKAEPSPAIWWETTRRQDWLRWLEEKLYPKVSMLALAEFVQISTRARLSYQLVTAVPLAEYARVRTIALIAFHRCKADAWRNIVPNPFVAPVQEARVQPLGGWSQPDTMGSTPNCGRPND